MSEEDHTEEPKPASKSFGWLSWFIVAVIVASLAGITQPVVIRSHRKSDVAEAATRLRLIGLALLEFENDFDEYPNENTEALVTKKHPEHGYDLSGKSSNALFRQLFVAELTQVEWMFYVKVQGFRKPDEVITSGNLLEKGEVAFAYIAGLSPDGNPARPIAFAPVITGTTRFDPKPFDGRAVILRIDNSVSFVVIGKDGHCRSIGGIDLLSPENPIWDGQAPDIRYPDL